MSERHSSRSIDHPSIQRHCGHECQHNALIGAKAHTQTVWRFLRLQLGIDAIKTYSTSLRASLIVCSESALHAMCTVVVRKFSVRVRRYCAVFGCGAILNYKPLDIQFAYSHSATKHDSQLFIHRDSYLYSAANTPNEHTCVGHVRMSTCCRPPPSHRV